eukprot:10349944-Lingulodinium_polyedra.AAC.1
MCARELLDWPLYVVKKLCAGPGVPRRVARLLCNLEHGCVLSTDFSGKGSVEACVRILDRGLQRSGLHLPDGWLALYACNDISERCQELA